MFSASFYANSSVLISKSFVETSSALSSLGASSLAGVAAASSSF